MTEPVERLLGLIDKAVGQALDKGAADGRASVAGAPFNLMATDDVARVVGAQHGALVDRVADAIALGAAGTVDANAKLSDAMSDIAAALEDIEPVDIQAVVNELQRLSQAIVLSGDKSRNGQKEVAEVVRTVISAIGQSQADAKANADRIVAATEKNTKALEKVAAMLGADKSVTYDDAGRPASIRVVK